MGNLKNTKINIKPAAQNTVKQEEPKLYAAKKANQLLGRDTSNITEDNVNISILNFFADLGCSIENCVEDFSFLRPPRGNDDLPSKASSTNTSFENQDDPFYEPDCAERKPKNNKQNQQTVFENADDTLPLLEEVVEDQTSDTVYQSMQQEGDFTASSGNSTFGLGSVGTAGTGFESTTRNTTSTTNRFYTFRTK